MRNQLRSSFFVHAVELFAHMVFVLIVESKQQLDSFNMDRLNFVL